MCLPSTAPTQLGKFHSCWKSAANSCQCSLSGGGIYSSTRLSHMASHTSFMMPATVERDTDEYNTFMCNISLVGFSYRYSASGDSLRSLAFSYRLGHAIVSNSVHMVCAAIEKNFPNCLGAVDGKHVTIQAPPLSVSQYFNYKKTFSIVLLALVDADYRFLVIQVGDFGRTSDGGVYAGSELGRRMASGTLNVPTCASLPGAAHQGNVQYVMVSDAAFPLKPYLMRSYPGKNLSHQKRIFNYRLSRARMVVENAFGILSSRWRIFHRKINLLPEHMDTLVMAACILLNFLIAPSENQRMLDEAEQLRKHMAPVRNMGGNRARREASNVREIFCTFFNSPEGSYCCEKVIFNVYENTMRKKHSCLINKNSHK
uniref:DDE Tnp4 domain-containing protein n=1 Tax=Paramormyrops kingsleyae TaxID=1676925 RepID=A0A3B3T7P1_9TELE